MLELVKLLKRIETIPEPIAKESTSLKLLIVHKQVTLNEPSFNNNTTPNIIIHKEDELDIISLWSRRSLA